MAWIIEIVVNLFGIAVAKDAKDDPLVVQQVAALGCFVGLALCVAVLWFVLH